MLLGVDENRKHNDGRQTPCAEADDFGVLVAPAVERVEGSADCKVPVDAQRGEGEDPVKPVERGGTEVNLRIQTFSKVIFVISEDR